MTQSEDPTPRRPRRRRAQPAEDAAPRRAAAARTSRSGSLVTPATQRAARKAARKAAPERGPKAPKASHSPIKVALSSSSVYPMMAPSAFEIAARLGYDGVEVMVWTDPVSQDPDALARLSARYGVPILAIHAPTLLITQRVWGKDPWAKITGAVDLAGHLGVDTVVVHPPFRWQVKYAEDFVAGMAAISRSSGVALAVENMYPWRAGAREIAAYLPGWDPTEHDYDHFTLDLSHSATAGVDGLALARRMGERLRHVHLADGTGSPKDEHLIPGRGTQPCAQVLSYLSRTAFTGHVVVEVNTRKAQSPAEREHDLTRALAFARHYLDRPELAGIEPVRGAAGS